MCDSESSIAHSAQCVYRHALFLSYMAYRGAVDGETNPRAAELVAKIPALFKQDWIEGLTLEPPEQRFIDAPFGSLTAQVRFESSWWVEGMAVLAWAVGQADLPPFYRKVNGAKVSVALGIFRPGALERVTQAALRDENEILMGARTYDALVWRLSQYLQDAKPAEFYKKLTDDEGRHLTIDGLEFLEGDLAVEGRPLGSVGTDELQEIAGIVYERNRRFRWLLGFEHGLATLKTVN
jgi:hypothetical protein